MKNNLMKAPSPAASNDSLPVHIAIIMDGNGRWAKAKGLPRTAGHKKGAESLRTVMNCCRDAGIRYLTVYAFSSENWKRPAEEISDLMQLLQHYLRQEMQTLHEHKIRLRFIGDLSLLNETIRDQAEDATRQTEDYNDFTLTIALSYGGRQEIVRAATALAEQVASGNLNPADIDESRFTEALDTAGLPEPDLLIRTGGEQRISNFLLWQSAYTEFYFTETLWPDFALPHFKDALDEFAKRERRYGNA